MHHKRRSRAREYREVDERQLPVREHSPAALKKTTTRYCKKRKGPHDYVFTQDKRYEYTVMHEDGHVTNEWFGYDTLKCSVCGKTKRKYAGSDFH